MYFSLLGNCVDESIIPCFGKHFAKQYMKRKTIKFGYKFWCFYKNNDYLVQYDTFYGKGDYNPEFGLEGSVVTKLIRKLSSGFKFNVTI